MTQLFTRYSMITFRFYQHGRRFLTFVDDSGMIDAYVMWAQLNHYGIEMEAL